tara:strand:- start:146 stop:757 length:612 start_codon:yes stop_codon:yes gene_type:complete
MKNLSVQKEMNKILSAQIDEARKVVGIVPVKKATSSATPSLDQTMAQHAKAYTRITNAAKKSLETFKEIGETLLLIKSDFESDKLFGQHIATTPLATISRRDRADMQWLASNWELIVEFKKENDYQGNSVQHLRTKVNAAIKAQEVETLDDDTENEGSGEAGTDIVPKTLDIVELTEKVLALAESNNISTKDLIKALQASLKA